jgi:1,4-alpha-glucan branching enzyme
MRENVMTLPHDTLTRPDQLGDLLSGALRDPFAYLGMHKTANGAVLRCFLPWAQRVEVVDRNSGEIAGALDLVADEGLYVGTLPRPIAYRLRVTTSNGTVDMEDPYRFPPTLGEVDIYLLSEGTLARPDEKLGSHVRVLDGVEGASFAVWAPNAHSVSLVGSFNDWDGRRHPMRFHPGCGVWDLFVPGLKPGDSYKYSIHGPGRRVLPLKADPYTRQTEPGLKTASVLAHNRDFPWADQRWMASREAKNTRNSAISIYEVHLGSWRRKAEDGGRYLTYRELAAELVPYVADLGFTHIELMPVSEYPYDGSWGYQPIGLFAPTSRFGTPDDFAALVDACHQAGLGLWIDWVPGHFPADEQGLALFDGTHLYEHADPRQGFQNDWNTFVFNFGRQEVKNYLISNALYWLDRYHVDGLRVDAVASMLYLDYSRKEGEWIPNAFGGRENLEAIAFLKQMNERAFQTAPGATTAAEESTAWPKVSAPTYSGGLGFGFKWNMGWMHDTLDYMSNDPVHRRYHQNKLTFGLLYAFSENFILPLSHDEVVHGKGSLLSRMPGDRWQKFANLRAYYGFMWSHPGKKLLFMGGEFAHAHEWNYDASLDWHLLDDPMHRGVQSAIRDLNHLYRDIGALHLNDATPDGFSWVDASDADHSVLSYVRYGADRRDTALVVCNFTPVPHENYRLGVPASGFWRERFNSDGTSYGGSGMGNMGGQQSQPIPSHGFAQSVALTLPPLSTTIFVYEPQ